MEVFSLESSRAVQCPPQFVVFVSPRVSLKGHLTFLIVTFTTKRQKKKTEPQLCNRRCFVRTGSRLGSAL